MWAGLDVFYGINCTDAGLNVEDFTYFDSGSWGLILDGCGTGVRARNVGQLSFTHVGISNCTTRVFDLKNTRLVRRTGWLYGTGNTGWGMDVSGVGNSFIDESVDPPFTAPTITGTLGDATVDGVTPILWTDLDAFGDYAVDEATGARIIKR
jgi:hypothetical protein